MSKLDDLMAAEPMVPTAALHVLLGYGLLEGVGAAGWDPPAVVLLAVYSVAAAGLQKVLSRWTWKRSSVVEEKAEAADYVRRQMHVSVGRGGW